MGKICVICFFLCLFVFVFFCFLLCLFVLFPFFLRCDCQESMLRSPPLCTVCMCTYLCCVAPRRPLQITGSGADGGGELHRKALLSRSLLAALCETCGLTEQTSKFRPLSDGINPLKYCGKSCFSTKMMVFLKVENCQTKKCDTLIYVYIFAMCTLNIWRKAPKVVFPVILGT